MKNTKAHFLDSLNYFYQTVWDRNEVNFLGSSKLHLWIVHSKNFLSMNLNQSFKNAYVFNITYYVLDISWQVYGLIKLLLWKLSNLSVLVTATL